MVTILILILGGVLLAALAVISMVRRRQPKHGRPGNPHWLRPSTIGGSSNRLEGDYDRALRDYEQAIPLNPNSANPYNNRGIIYRIKGDYDRAIADYDEAIWLKSGNYPAAFYNRALAYADKVEYDHALTDFDVVSDLMRRMPWRFMPAG